MRPARRADPPHRPDHSKKPRSPLQSPSPDRLPDPSAGAQSFTHSDTDISLPPIASYPTPQLGSKMTKARTADCFRPNLCLQAGLQYADWVVERPHCLYNRSHRRAVGARGWGDKDRDILECRFADDKCYEQPDRDGLARGQWVCAEPARAGGV